MVQRKMLPLTLNVSNPKLLTNFFSCSFLLHQFSSTLLVAPLMAIKGKTFITIKRNDQLLKLNCRVYGSPLPTIHWLKDGMYLRTIGNAIHFQKSSPNFTVTQKGGQIGMYNSSLSYSISNETMSKCSLKSTLTLTVMNVHDLGVYNCIALNVHGKSQALYRITGEFIFLLLIHSRLLLLAIIFLFFFQLNHPEFLLRVKSLTSLGF